MKTIEKLIQNKVKISELKEITSYKGAYALGITPVGVENQYMSGKINFDKINVAIDNLNEKQDKLIPGNGIIIDENQNISIDLPLEKGAEENSLQQIGCITSGENEIALGKYNLSDNSVFTIGDGENAENPSNVIDVKRDGKIFVKDLGYYTGNNSNVSYSLQDVIKQNGNKPGLKTIEGGEIFNYYGNGLSSNVVEGSMDGSVIFHFPKNNTAIEKLYTARIYTEENAPVKEYNITMHQDGQPKKEPSLYNLTTDSNATYNIVKSNLEDWSGDYILLGKNKTSKEYHIFDNFGSNIGLPVMEGEKNIDFSKNIKTNTLGEEYFNAVDVDLHKAIITKSKNGPADSYNIFVSNVGYIGLNSISKNSLDRSSQLNDNKNFQWKIEYSGGSLKLSTIAFPDNKLYYNSQSPRFCCYSKSTQSPITFFKRQENLPEKHFEVLQTDFQVSAEDTHVIVTITSDVHWMVDLTDERNQAKGLFSHAEGKDTIATAEASHAEGKYNVDIDSAIHMVGIGSSDSERKNAHTITNDGKHYILELKNLAGNKQYSGNESVLPEGADLVSVINELQAKIKELESKLPK